MSRYACCIFFQTTFDLFVFFKRRVLFCFLLVDRFWMVPINEPTVLLGAFLDRYKSACLLEQQLPAMKPEQLKAMV